MDAHTGMKTIRLRPRLARALDLLQDCGTLADVGCDHGRLGLAALVEGKVSRAVAADISAASLQKARALFERFGLAAEFVQTNGLAGLDASDWGRYCVAILGMGGELIAGILKKGEAAARGAERLILQPMGGERELRSFLYAGGYAIPDEDVVFDAGRYYQLIAARYSPDEVKAYPDEALLEFGAVAYQKRQEALLNLLKKVRASRERRMERAIRHGKTPENLARELAGVLRLIENWEGEEI